MVAQSAYHDSLGQVLAARDQKTQRRVALRIFPQGLVKGDALKVLRNACRSASEISHPAVISTYGMGPDGFGGAFVAHSWVEGATLARVIQQRGEEGEPISARGTLTVIKGIAAGLEAAHAKLCHGALRTESIWIGAKGSVRTGGFGIDSAMLKTTGIGTFTAQSQSCFAPEVKAGKEPTNASDIFGLGSVLYTMLTGRFPGNDFVMPSQIREDIPAGVDALLLECLAPDPKARPQTPGEIAQRLSELLAEAPNVSFEDDFGIAVTLAPELSQATPPPPDKPVSLAGRPQVGSRISIHESFRPSDDFVETSSALIRIQDAVARVSEDDTPRWMVVKDGLDYGPWSGREVAKRLVTGRISGEDGLLNMETGEKLLICEHSEFQGFVDEHQRRDAEAKEVAAVQRDEVVERRSNRAKLFGGVAILAIIAAVLVAYFATRDDAVTTDEGEADLLTLYQSGHFDDVEGTSDILEAPPLRRGRRGAGMSPARSGGGNLTYEEAMNQVMDIGDVTMNGGEARLSPQQVAGVMNRHINQLFGCVVQEQRQGGRLTNVQIDLAIAGTGELLGASTRQGSQSFKRCIQSRTRGIRFPTFSAPRMGARFSFSAN